MIWNSLELPDKPYFQDDAVVIYCADCRDVLPLIPDKSIDLVLTDPPYGLGFSYTQFEDNQDNLVKLIQVVLPQILRVSKRSLITCGHTNIWHYPPANWIMAWIFGTTNQRNSWGFTSWQPILAYGKDSYLANGAGARMDIINDSRVPTRYEMDNHPCPKPKSFIKKLIVRGSFDSGDIILDTFMGIGTTLIASKELNRKCIGIEIEKKYCEIAAKRLSQSVMRLVSNGS